MQYTPKSRPAIPVLSVLSFLYMIKVDMLKQSNKADPGQINLSDSATITVPHSQCGSGYNSVSNTDNTLYTTAYSKQLPSSHPQNTARISSTYHRIISWHIPESEEKDRQARAKCRECGQCLNVVTAGIATSPISAAKPFLTREKVLSVNRETPIIVTCLSRIPSCKWKLSWLKLQALYLCNTCHGFENTGYVSVRTYKLSNKSRKDLLVCQFL